VVAALHGLLGEVVAAQHLGEAQSIPEEGAPAEALSANELASGDLRMTVTTAHMDDLAGDMAGVSENGEASNETPKPKSKGVSFKSGVDVEMQETEALGAEDDTEGEQAEDDTDAIMNDWDEESHTPTTQVEEEKACGASCLRRAKLKTPGVIGSARTSQLKSSCAWRITARKERARKWWRGRLRKRRSV
jgi:hypothetical protein